MGLNYHMTLSYQKLDSRSQNNIFNNHQIRSINQGENVNWDCFQKTIKKRMFYSQF